MFSLNDMKSFESKPNIKTVQAWPKANNIISFKVLATHSKMSSQFEASLKFIIKFSFT